MRCPHCNQEHADTLSFCPYTGQPIKLDVKPPRCAHCGEELPPRMRFCPCCGEPAPGWEEVVDKPEGALAGFSRPTLIRPKLNRKRLPSLPLILLILAALVGAVLFGMWNGSIIDQALGRVAPSQIVLVVTATAPATLPSTPTLPPTQPLASPTTVVVIPPPARSSDTPQPPTNTPTSGPPTDTPTPLPPTDTPAPAASPTPARVAKYARYDLAFISDRDQRWQVILMNSQDPQDWLAVPPPPEYDWVEWPTFCGERVAFEAEDRQLTQPRWVYFFDFAQETYQPLPLADKSVTRIAAPSCSPSGKLVAYSAARGSKWFLQIFDFRTQQALFDLNSDEYAGAGFVTWQQDESVFYWMGTHFNSFTDVNETRDFPASPQTSLYERGRYPALSPDGKYLAFFCTNLNYLCVLERQSDLIVTNRAIHYVALYRGQPAPATAAWSADSQWVYFTSSLAGNWDIYRMHVDGSELQNLTEGWGSDELMIGSR